MEEQPSGHPYCGTHEVCTDLAFSKLQIYIANEAIKSFAKDSRQIEELELEEGIYGGTDVSLIIRLNKKIQKLIERHVLTSGNPTWAHIDQDAEAHKDSIVFIWDQYNNRDNITNDRWYMEKHGKANCGKHYLDILEGKVSYDSCPCPEAYKAICQFLTNTLKKASAVNPKDVLKFVYKE